MYVMWELEFLNRNRTSPVKGPCDGCRYLILLFASSNLPMCQVYESFRDFDTIGLSSRLAVDCRLHVMLWICRMHKATDRHRKKNMEALVLGMLNPPACKCHDVAEGQLAANCGRIVTLWISQGERGRYSDPLSVAGRLPAEGGSPEHSTQYAITFCIEAIRIWQQYNLLIKRHSRSRSGPDPSASEHISMIVFA